MTTPGPRRLGRRDHVPAAIAEREAAAEDERRRLVATVGRLRLELARLRGELDDESGAGPADAELVGVAVEAGEAGAGDADPVAEAESRAGDAERRVRLLAEELAAERRERDRLDTALREERDARLTLEALRDGLEGAMEDQRRRHEREVTDVQEAVEAELRTDLGAARSECAGLRERLEAENAARERAERRCRQLDREVDELRNWISAVESRRRGLFRRSTPPPPNL